MAETPTPPGMSYRPMIRDLPTSERPRERLRDYGPSALSNAELLAILLRTGTSRASALDLAAAILARRRGLAGLARVNFGELCTEKGLGEAKAAQVMAALELGRRVAAAQPEERPSVTSPQDVANLLGGELSHLDQEELRLLLLNTRNHLVGIHTVYRGNVNSAVVRVGEVLREAVRQGVPAVIVVHNHPSGDPTPSRDDVTMTRKLVEAGRLLDVEVLDHVVIGGQRFVSLRERGLGFEVSDPAPP